MIADGLALATMLAGAPALVGPLGPETPASSEQAIQDPSPPEQAAPIEAPPVSDRLSREEAERHFLEATALLSEGKYAEAAAEFRRSYVAFKTGSALYNMALAYEKAGDAVAAVGAYQEYLLRDDLSDARRREVGGVLDQLRRNVAEVDLSILDGVLLREIRVDGKVVPLSDFPVLVAPGTIEIELYGTGAGQRRVRSVRVDGGQRLAIEVAPFGAPTVGEVDGPSSPVRDVSRPRPSTRTEARHRALRGVFWTGIGLVGAGTVTTAVVGSLSLYHARRYNETKCPMVCDDAAKLEHPEFESAPRHERQAKDLQLATNITIGITAAVAVATVVVGVLAYPGRRSGRAAKGARRFTQTMTGFAVGF